MFIKSFSYSLAAVLLSSTSAFAMTCLNDYSGTSGCAGNQTPAGDCSTLGYSKANVDGCVKYLYCPFDTSYKRCITQKAMDCSDYPLTKCPDNGFCSECNDGSTTKYKLDSCKEGYKLSGNTCVADNKCDGYTLTQCPTNGICSECVSGSTTKYKLDSCKEGYYKSGNSCLPNTCSGFTLSTCPDNGNCSQCLSGSSYKFKLDSCKDGHKISGNNCIAKTCYDYGGYSSIPTNGLVCKDHKSFKLGTSTGLCYTDCISCESLSTNVPYRSYSPEEACNSYGNQGPACLYASPNASVSGYTYGRCIIYDAKCPGALPCGDCNMCCSEHSRDNPEICQVLGGNPSDLLPGWND